MGASSDSPTNISIIYYLKRIFRLRMGGFFKGTVGFYFPFLLHRAIRTLSFYFRWFFAPLGHFCRLIQNKAKKNRIAKVFYAVFLPWLRLKCSQWNNHCCAFILVKTKIQRKILLPLRFSSACQKDRFLSTAHLELAFWFAGENQNVFVPMHLQRLWVHTAVQRNENPLIR